jgi:hypothetical protein
MLLWSSLHAVAGFITFASIPVLLLAFFPYCVGSPAVAFIPSVIGGHVIAVILAVACCWHRELLVSVLLLASLFKGAQA